ncbi:MAG: hypothetical protein QOK00_1093 [Thermoleophilaceae bacterium]|jgi:hypothetical protein|nr:hypothetical protein [Thermoleophilaceae bacterium]
MTPALLESPLHLFAQARMGAAAGGPRMTLEERLEGAWRSVNSAGRAECPVCHADMHLDNGLGRCNGCGTALS